MVRLMHPSCYASSPESSPSSGVNLDTSLPEETSFSSTEITFEHPNIEEASSPVCSYVTPLPAPTPPPTSRTPTAPLMQAGETFPCPICSKGFPIYQDRPSGSFWLHLNSYHIARAEFPSHEFLTHHDRLICSSSGCHWVYHRRFSRLGCQRRIPNSSDKCRGQLVTLASLPVQPTSSLPSNHNPSPLPSSTPLPNLPSWDAILGTFHPILHHVPKSARDEWANAVNRAFSSILSDPANPEIWKLIFMLPRCILLNSSCSTRNRFTWRDTVKAIKSRIARWRDGDMEGLWSDFVTRAHHLTTMKSRSPPTSTGNTRATNARRAKRAVEASQFRKALQSLSSHGLARPSPETLEEMKAKHPRAPPPTPLSSPPPTPIQVGEDDVLRALRSFLGDSSPGPSLLSANHLKEAVLCRSPDRGPMALQAITAVVNLLCKGQVPPEVAPHLCGATLVAAYKKGGGLRPIAVGEVLRRLTSKCLSWAVRAAASSYLVPLQLGVGVKAGCEAIVHAVRSVIQDPDIPPESRSCLLLDFQNAFNNIGRQHIFGEVRSRLPGLAAWMECCYGTQPILHFGDYTILSQCGVQQGDPLGPLAFGLALHPIVEKIKSEVPTLNINVWYLDDGTLCGTPDDLARALHIVEEDGPARGLHLNRRKSLLFIPQDASALPNPLPADIPSTSEGFGLLGAPIGPPEFVESSIMNRVQKIEMAVDQLGDLEDSQLATALLRSCLAFPKLNFALRTCPPAGVYQPARVFDEAIRTSISDIAGGPLSDWAWKKASLPSSLGGLNLRSASLHAPAAYLSSIQLTRPLVADIRGQTPPLPLATPSAVADLAHSTNHPSWSSLEDIDVPLRQKTLSRCIDEVTFQALVDSAPDARSRALAMSSALPHAGDWLNAIPSRALGLHIPNRDFILCLSYWLGLPVTNRMSACPACGSGNADVLGDHQVGCGGNSDRISRHNALRDALFSAAQSAALAPRLEAPSLVPSSSSRPADIFIPNWQAGRPAALDVSVISTLQPLTLSGSALSQGHALQVGEDRKVAAHQEDCLAVGVDFIPLIAETLGGWSVRACELIRRISRLMANRVGSSPSDTTTHLFQRLSICLWRGNAAMWANRQPTIAPSVDGII